jgi:hypothetical protein
MLDSFVYVDKIITETVLVVKTYTEKPELIFLFLIKCAGFLFFIKCTNIRKITN